jgi:hypothetical protein
MATPNPASPAALDSGMIDASTSVFDYGCGRGEDIALLLRIGREC